MNISTADLEGHVTLLRIVAPEDAAYIWGLRNDPRYNAHLSQSSGTVEDQRAWITRYKEREAAGSEYYFIIRRRDDDRRCGTVRIYDIREGHFTWGSWILDEAKPPRAALDTALLVYRFGFDRLGLDRAVFDVRRENTHTLAFHDRFGATRTGEDGQDVFFELPRSRFGPLASRHAAAFGES
ncbi:GNAT family N-acetyltransferase [Plastorhodobacter daqingensis]|uniref:GNAT family N-acetyltransferase n=1 Tax=Plastorhodobacter daqingensis TaxID=1387281 RepID=A0ABW2UMH2_9RHOB